MDNFEKLMISLVPFPLIAPDSSANRVKPVSATFTAEGTVVFSYTGCSKPPNTKGFLGMFQLPVSAIDIAGGLQMSTYTTLRRAFHDVPYWSHEMRGNPANFLQIRRFWASLGIFHTESIEDRSELFAHSSLLARGTQVHKYPFHIMNFLWSNNELTEQFPTGDAGFA
jgi:hypothetical protein